MVAQKTVTADLREIKTVKITCGGCGAAIELPIGSSEIGIRKCPFCNKNFHPAVLGALQQITDGLARLQPDQADRLTVTLTED